MPMFRVKVSRQDAEQLPGKANLGFDFAGPSD